MQSSRTPSQADPPVAAPATAGIVGCYGLTAGLRLTAIAMCRPRSLTVHTDWKPTIDSMEAAGLVLEAPPLVGMDPGIARPGG